MESTVISSSDEDDDIYLNSVARLKALKKKSSKNIIQEQKKEEEKKEETIEEPPKTEIVPTGRVTRGQAQRAKALLIESRPVRKKKSTRKSTQAIVLDSDSDVEIVPVEDTNTRPCEEENYDINVKVHWRSKNVHRVNIRRQESFSKVFQYFADMEGVSVDEILIKMKDRVIQKTDTPSSVNLTVIDILEGGIVTRSARSRETAEHQEIEASACTIKVQMTDKKSLTVGVKKDENFTTLFAKCAEAFGVERSKIKLYFDGEPIGPSDTLDSLDIEEEEACFDLRLST